MIWLNVLLSFNFALGMKSMISYDPIRDPQDAALAVSTLMNRPDIYEGLVSICMRESRCEAVGIHTIDAHLSPRSYWGQVRLGHLDRTCQRHGYEGRWSTRGPWGLNAAAHWQFFHKCYQPELLDYPLVSAWVAAKKYVNVCNKSKKKGKKLSAWCPKKPKRKNTYSM